MIGCRNRAAYNARIDRHDQVTTGPSNCSNPLKGAFLEGMSKPLGWELVLMFLK